MDTKYAVVLHGDNMDIEVIFVIENSEGEATELATRLYRQDNDLEDDRDIYIDDVSEVSNINEFLVTGHVEGGDNEHLYINAENNVDASKAFTDRVYESVKGNYPDEYDDDVYHVPPIYVDSVDPVSTIARTRYDLSSTARPGN